MADDYATAYTTTTPPTQTNGVHENTDLATPQLREPDNPKPGLWAYLPFDAPLTAQKANDLAVKYAIIEPLNKLDQGLKKTRNAVKGAAFAAQALLFRGLE